jgi:hypothetical protein
LDTVAGLRLRLSASARIVGSGAPMSIRPRMMPDSMLAEISSALEPWT